MSQHSISLRFVLIAFGICVAQGPWLNRAAAELRMPSVFSDHMVLQQDQDNAIWGWDESSIAVQIQVRANGKVLDVKTTADKTGRWSATLPKFKAGSTIEISVKGTTEQKIVDVLVGEVWVASGQSNMAMPVRGAKNAQQEQAAAKYPSIRMFQTKRVPATSPQNDVEGQWVVCAPETVGSFSATAYYFARDLHHQLKQPVGIIHASWGGTAVEAWTSRAAQDDMVEIQPLLNTWDQRVKAHDSDAAKTAYETALKKWKAAVEKAKAAGRRVPRRPTLANPELDQNRPSNLFNGMIHPFIPYGIRGAIWYQGERNRRQYSHLYGEQLQCLIEDWRTRWGLGDFPFLFVQLPNYLQPQSAPVEPDGWVNVRDGMDRTLQLPNTGMAVTLDVGEASDIHPKNKQDVGKRLARWALAKTYGKELVCTGPRLKSHSVKDGVMTLEFDHVGDGLKAKGDQLEGFAIAGPNRKFVWAQAALSGNKVVVSHDSIKNIASVRYAWAPNPKATLFNSEGLPAAPFRTDNWPLKAAGDR